LKFVMHLKWGRKKAKHERIDSTDEQENDVWRDSRSRVKHRHWHLHFRNHLP
jgi:hypothetical protein